MNQIKILPHSIEAEQALLCSCLVKPQIIIQVLQDIGPEDFYRDAHKLIFEAMIALYNKKIRIDFVTLKDALAENYQRVGGDDYITSLSDVTSTSAGWQAHVHIIKERSDQRKIIILGMDVAQEGYTEIPDNLLQKLKENIRLIERHNDTEIKDNQRLYDVVYHKIYEKQEPGLYSGISCLKDKIYFEKGYIHAVAAKSGTGKSAFLLQVGDNISRQYGPVLFYSMESTRERLAMRQIARHSAVALTRLNKSSFTGPDQEEKILDGINELVNSRLILIDNSAFQEVERLCAHAESYALQHDVSAIMIDFLQLMSSRKKHNTRHHEISYIVNQFKGLAKDLGLPLLYASQLRKDVTGKPSLDDLKESGDIRTLSDNILFLYAPNDDKTIYPVEAFLAKGKDQERFSQWLEFNGNFQRFSEGERPEKSLKKDVSL